LDEYDHSGDSEDEILAVKGKKGVAFSEGDIAKDEDVDTDLGTCDSQEDSPDNEDPEAKELSSNDGW
jgi:hypothetical protein